MSLRINLNNAAQVTQRVLGSNDASVSRSIERLSTGYKINRASDGPAGLAISESLRAQIGGLKQAIANTQDAVNMVKTAEGALNEVHSLLRSMRDLAVHAMNTGAVDEAQLAADQAQISSAIQALDRVATNTAFGGKKLLDGTAGVQGSVTSGSGALFLGGNENTVAGNYTVTVNQVATQRTYVGQANGAAAVVTASGGSMATAFGAGDAGNLVFELANGALVTVAFTAGDNAAALETKVDAAFAAVGAPYEIEASLSGNDLVLTQTTAGYEPAVTISATSDAATLAKIGLTAGTTHGSGLFTAQSTAGTLTLNGVNIDIAANDTSAALVARINNYSSQTGVTASTSAGGQLSLTSNAYGSGATITVAASGGYSLANLFGTAVETAGQDVNLTVARAGGQTITSAGTGQVWTGADGGETDGLQLKITSAGAKSLMLTNGSLMFQVGSEVGQTASVALAGTGTSVLGVGAADLETSAANIGDIDVTSLAGARDALRLIDAAISQVSTQRSNLGAAQANVFESAINSLSVASENISASESAIRDTDMASEMTQFAKSQILVQATVAMLAQANQAPQALLQLLR